MAHVFYADRNPKNFKDNSDDKWANQMGYVFAFMEYWNKYRIYRIFNWIPLRIANGIGGIAGKLVLNHSTKYRKKLKKSYEMLFPYNNKFANFQNAYSAYLGKLTFAFMGGLTTKKAPPDTSFAQFENIELIDRELAKGKGLIISITHLGELTQAIWALAKHPKKYTLATVVYVPHMGIYRYSNHPYYDNVYFYASTSFRYIASFLEDHLKKNHIVMIYYDFGHPGQFRVPFWHGKFKYLLYTPQSIMKLHRNTGASILPCVNLPDQVIGKTKMVFKENAKIMRVSKEFQKKSDNEFHGAISMELNKVYAPYLRAYAHVWEQFLDFNKRISLKIKFPAMLSLAQITECFYNSMVNIIKTSYEPKRDDKKLFDLLDQSYQNCVLSLINPEYLFRSNPSFINLTGLSSLEELDAIINIFIFEFDKINEYQAKEKLINLRTAFHSLT